MTTRTALLLSMLALGPALAWAQDATPANNGVATLRIQSNMVLTNVVVRDRKTGKPIEGLKREDFSILEDGKPQQIVSFDYENVDQAARLNEATITGKVGQALQLGKSSVAPPEELRDHRMIVLFFDTVSLQPDDMVRVQQAARDYINKTMAPADVVSVVSLGNTLSVDQDFTQDKTLLLHAIDSYSPGGAQGYAAGATATANQTEDATSFTPDESEFNDLNTDRELFAIASIAKSLSTLNQKKSLLYFSGGIQRDGIENQASLRAAINQAVRANMAIYSVDARGLQAVTPLGDATTGSLRGTSGYNGAALQNNLDSNFNTQEVMATLSSDTGGKAFFDDNDFAPAFTKVQQDSASYYTLGFRSTSTLRDGRFRKLQIRVNRTGMTEDVKLEYRPGYYAPADFRHSNRDDRERDLEAELASDLPATDVTLYLQPFFFRTTAKSYSVPVSLVVPGSQIPFTKGGDRDKATLDVIGQLKDASGHVLSDVRDTVKLAVDQTQQVSRKNIQYSTGFSLPPGKYHLKFVVRENETGKMGSFETDINVPDLSRDALKMSSVVLASQKIASPGKKNDSPLLRDGMQLVPNLPHVFRADQPLYFLYEVYDPAHAAQAAAAGKPAVPAGVHLLTSIEFLSGTVKVYETPLIDARATNVPGRDAVAFQFTVPLTSLKDGLYLCQVNVIDDTGGTFSFPRTAVVVRSGTVTPAATP